MPRPAEELRRDALAIWQAGVEAVRSDRLVCQTLRVQGSMLSIGDDRWDLDAIGRIAVVGAGKAGAGMAAGVEAALGPRWLEAKQVTGWVNVPEDCVRPLSRIHLHGARPAGVNEPTAAGVAGSLEIRRLVELLDARDLCLCLISGGGSALMPAPVEGITLDDKLALTRHLSASGANIEQLNTVRKQLSRIKGGGLARACRAGRLVALIISDVLGDPLDVIASGPTVEDSATPADALDVLAQFAGQPGAIPERVFAYLKERLLRDSTHPTRARHDSPDFTFCARRGSPDPAAEDRSVAPSHGLSCQVTNRIIGNNTTAAEAAGREAARLGYATTVETASCSEGLAEDLGRQLAERSLHMRRQAGRRCTVSGGEPVVKLVDPAQRGLGGRNQQLVLAALDRLLDDGSPGIVILSGGTDGEDGPTDAAGALVDASTVAVARQRGLCPNAFLARNDAYHFFEPLGALLRTGPTHTNVCDLRVIVADGSDAVSG